MTATFALICVLLAGCTVAAPRSVPVQPVQSGAPLDPARVPAAVIADVRPVGTPGAPYQTAPYAVEKMLGSGIMAGGAPPLAAVTYQGSLAYADPSYGPLYLALPEPRGTRAEICGPAACVTRTSNDYGPDQRKYPDRIADLSAVDFEKVCGMTPAQRILHGRCPGTVLILKRARTPLPQTDTDSIAQTGFGFHGPPRLSTTAVCRSTGPQAVWVAQTGTAFLDIIQVGTMDGELFWAYGRGEPNGPRSLYVERHLGSSGAGPHRYGVALDARVWTLTVDGRVVATISDTFRTWRLRATQVMAEGTGLFGAASCSLPDGRWSYSGYGPQPATAITATSWRVT